MKLYNRIILLLIAVTFLVFWGYTISTSSKIKPDIHAVTTIEKPVSPEKEINPETINLLIKDYIMDNPEVIISSIEQLQKRKMKEGAQKVSQFIEENKDSIEAQGTYPVLGNKNAKITITTFYDYKCSYCTKAEYNLNEVVEQDDQVKIILRPFPILGEISTYAAQIVLSVNKIAPEKFRAIHEQIFASAPLTKEAIQNILKANQMNIDEVEQLANSKAIKAEIDETLDLASRVGVHGTPAYIINQQIYPGLLDSAQILQIINDIRANRN